MGQKHRRVLSSILQEPVSGNIHWREVESLLNHLGASIETGHGARMRVVINGTEGMLTRPHHSGVCSKQEIRHLRDYLLSAGISMDSIEHSNK
jgi:hypothetical protein